MVEKNYPCGNLSPVFDPETLLASGRKAHCENQCQEARDLFAQAVAESRWVADTALLAKALKALGQIERELKHGGTAIDCYSEAVGIYRGSGDRLACASALRHIAEILAEQKSLIEAEAVYSEALEIYRTHAEANPLEQAHAMRGLAQLKSGGQAHEEALFLWQGASHLYGAAGEAARVAECDAHVAFLLGR